MKIKEKKTPSRKESYEKYEEEEEEEEEEDKFDPNNPDDVFARCEKNYNKVSGELEENPAMTKYADAFTNLFDFLYNVREQSLALADQKNQLKEDLAETEVRLEGSFRMIEQDAIAIESLKGEIQKSHQLIDNAHAREQAAQEVIDNLRRTITNLNSEIEFKNKMATTDLEENPKVAKHRQGLEREKAKLISEVVKLSDKLDSALAYQEDLEHRTDMTDIKIRELSDELDATSNEMEKYKRNKEKIEEELLETGEEVLARDAEINSLTETINVNTKVILKFDAQVKAQTASANKCFKELEVWNTRFCRMQTEYDNLTYQVTIMKRQNEMSTKNLRRCNDEQAKVTLKLTELAKQREMADQNAMATKKEGLAIKVERVKLREEIGDMEMEIMHQKIQSDFDRRRIQNNFRETEILKRNMLRQKAVTRDHINIIKTQDSRKKKLETEIEGHLNEMRKGEKQIAYLERERDRLVDEGLDKNKRMEELMEDLRGYKLQIFDLKKVLAENRNKLRMQQNLYEAVRADRSAFEKSLSEANGVTNELREKLSINYRQNEQMKEDIASKEILVHKSESQMRKLLKETQNMKVEHNLRSEENKELKLEIQERKTAEKLLHQSIAQSDRLIKSQDKSILGMMNERDVLGAQLVRRNDELALLYEKVAILQTTLRCGMRQHEERMTDFQLLKIEIKRLRQDKLLLTNTINNMNDLKQEVFYLERDLNRERMKCRALEQEMRNPMNVHRWRKLQGSDPEVFELLQKINLLQKRYLHQSNQMLDRERQLKSAESLYKNLRQMVAKQPGPQFRKRLKYTQSCLLNSNSRIKCLVSELSMVEAQNHTCNIYLERVSEELRDAKCKLLDEKKKHQKTTGELRGLRKEADDMADKSPLEQVGAVLRKTRLTKATQDQ